MSEWHPILQSAILSIGFNLLLYIPAYFLKTDKLTDISYALTFFGLGLIGFLNGSMVLPYLLLMLMIGLWAVRLGGYLLLRIYKMGRDSRFDEMHKKPLNYFGFWLIQGSMVPIVMIPSTLYFSTESTELGVTSYVGLAIFLIGFLIEIVADQQKFSFKSDPNHASKWTNVGLWKSIRHPNYLGEIMVWAGVYIFCISNLVGYELILGAVSPLFVFTMLRFVSGIPLLEKSARNKWGDDPEFQDYLASTGRLLPKF